MKALVAHGPHGYTDKQHFNWCERSEWLCTGTNFRHSDNCFVGVESRKGTMLARVVEYEGDALAESLAAPFFTGWQAAQGQDAWIDAAVNLDVVRTELETLFFQAGQFPVGTVVRRSADRLGLEKVT